MIALTIVLILVALSVVSAVLGADSRDGNDWGWHPRH